LRQGDLLHHRSTGARHRRRATISPPPATTIATHTQVYPLTMDHMRSKQPGKQIDAGNCVVVGHRSAILPWSRHYFLPDPVLLRADGEASKKYLSSPASMSGGRFSCPTTDHSSSAAASLISRSTLEADARASAAARLQARTVAGFAEDPARMKARGYHIVPRGCRCRATPQHAGTRRPRPPQGQLHPLRRMCRSRTGRNPPISSLAELDSFPCPVWLPNFEPRTER